MWLAEAQIRRVPISSANIIPPWRKSNWYLRSGPQTVIVSDGLDPSGFRDRDVTRLVPEVNPYH